MSSFRNPNPDQAYEPLEEGMHVKATGGGLWSIERVVALLTPVFAAASGWLTTVVAKAIPGLTIPRDDLTFIFVTGAVAAAGAALKWLHGRQKFVNFTTDAEKVAQGVVSELAASGLLNVPAVQDIEHVVVSHQGEIIDAIQAEVAKLHSPLADEIAKQVVAQFIRPPAPAQAAPAVAVQAQQAQA